MNTKTVKKIGDDWIVYIKPLLKQSSYNKYYNLLHSYIYPYLGYMIMSNLTTSSIEMWVLELLNTGGKKQNGLSYKTIHDILTLFKSIIKYYRSYGGHSQIDFNKIKVKKPRKKLEVLSVSEQNKLTLYLRENLNGVNIGILLSLYTGLRIGEICALCWEDISFDNQTIYIHKTMQRIQVNGHPKTKVIITSPKSECSKRIIPINSTLLSILQKYQNNYEGYILTGTCNKYMEPRTLENHFKKILTKCDLKSFNYHTLRHTFATRCIEVGFDVKSLSEILGHSSVNITMNRYVHPTMELKKENMNKLSKYLGEHE